MQPETIPQSPAPEQPFAAPPVSDNGEGWRSSLSTIALFLSAPLIALFLTTFIFHPYEVDGPSMLTTLENGDRLIVLKTGQTWATMTGQEFIPKRGDIIVFRLRNSAEAIGSDKQLIKRVVALPGERVVVENGNLTVFNDARPNGFQPDTGTDYGRSITTTPGNVDYTLAQDEVFAVGDNRSNSSDSRDFGPINSNEIVGTLELRIYPFSEFESF